MHANAARAIEQRRGVTAMHAAQWIVDAMIRCPFEHGLTPFNGDQIQAKLLDHWRLFAARHHSADLTEPIEGLLFLDTHIDACSGMRLSSKVRTVSALLRAVDV